MCGLDDAGESTLVRQSFCAPFHISKPYREERALVVNVINSTAGLFSGDRIRCDVRVNAGAELVLTAPSANRIHRMISGDAASEQEFYVESGACLDVWPHLMIPQRGARFRQTTKITLERDAELLFFEMIAPGRVASGEVFEFARLDWLTQITCDSVCVARERYTITPETESLRALRKHFGAAYTATAFVFSNIPSNAKCWSDIAGLHCDNAWIGISRLCETGWVVKTIARDSVALMSAATGIRTTLRAAMQRGDVLPRRF